jgi:hypothetical protein
MIARILTAAAFATVLGATAASAQVSIGVQIGRPVYGYVDPYYYAPPPPVMVVAPEPRVVVVQPRPMYVAPRGYYYRSGPPGRAVGHYKHHKKHYKREYRGHGRGYYRD